jgi:hypothetical protein
MSKTTYRFRWVRLASLPLLAGGILACNDASVTDTSLVTQSAVTPPTPTQLQAQLCASGPAGTYDFTVSETDPNNIQTLNAGTSVSLQADQCVLIATTTSAPFSQTADVTVTWNGTPITVTLTNIDKTTYAYSGSGDTNPTATTTSLAGPAASITLGLERAGLLVFNFAAIPEETLEGCSPGYWKQSQHFGSYPAGYAPTDLFDTYFENAFPGLTLLQVLSQGGGGLKSLGRHAVAALLSSAAGLDTGMTAQEVIDAFDAVFPGGNYAALTSELEEISDATCTLN